MSRFDQVITGLVDQGWFVGADLLPLSELLELASEARRRWDVGAYHPAGIGRDSSYTIEPDIRGDSIHWIDESDDVRAIVRYREAIEHLRQELNRQLYLGLDSFEVQFARYPEGSAYDRHIDRFSDRTLRTISCILYLNSEWNSEDGGALRLWLDGGTHDVVPVLGRWVIFRSDLIEHEVRPARRPRFSVTGWFRRRPLNPLL